MLSYLQSYFALHNMPVEQLLPANVCVYKIDKQRNRFDWVKFYE